MVTPEQLENWTRYHAPTEETAPKYAAIRAAEDAVHTAVFNAVYSIREQQKTNPPAYDIPYDLVNAAVREFIVVIDASAPDSADKTAAIRCARLARNAANEALTAASREVDCPIHKWVNADTMEAEAHRQAVLARFQANSAVACGGK